MPVGRLRQSVNRQNKKTLQADCAKASFRAGIDAQSKQGARVNRRRKQSVRAELGFCRALSGGGAVLHGLAAGSGDFLSFCRCVYARRFWTVWPKKPPASGENKDKDWSTGLCILTR